MPQHDVIPARLNRLGERTMASSRASFVGNRPFRGRRTATGGTSTHSDFGSVTRDRAVLWLRLWLVVWFGLVLRSRASIRPREVDAKLTGDAGPTQHCAVLLLKPSLHYSTVKWYPRSAEYPEGRIEARFIWRRPLPLHHRQHHPRKPRPSAIDRVVRLDGRAVGVGLERVVGHHAQREDLTRVRVGLESRVVAG